MKSNSRLTSILLLSILLTAPSLLALEWETLLSEADQHFADGDFALAADKYNRSAELALESGEMAQAARIYASLAECYSENRLADREIFNRYMMEAARLAAMDATLAQDPAESAGLYLEAAEYAREAGSWNLYAEYIRGSASGHVDVAAGKGFRDASDSLRRAAYLLHFNNMTADADQVLADYRERAYAEVERLIEVAENGSVESEDVARAYMDAASILSLLDDPLSGNYFGLASAAFETLAYSISPADPRDISGQAHLFEMAGIAAGLNYSRAEGLFASAAARYREAAESLPDTGEYLTEARGNLTSAARLHERIGMRNESREEYAEVAALSERMANSTVTLGYLRLIEAARAYDRAGMHKEAYETYVASLNSFPSDFSTLPLPWQNLDLFEILGRGRRIISAREYSRYLSQLGLEMWSFFGAPSYGGYDMMIDLGEGMLDDAESEFRYRVYVSESLLMASAFVISGLPEAAQYFVDGIPADILEIDPPNKALLDLLLQVIDHQLEGRTSVSQGLTARELAVTSLYDQDICDAMDQVLPGQVFGSRCRAMYRIVIDDLMTAATYRRDVDDLYAEAVEIEEELVDSNLRNVTTHLKVSEIYSSAGWRLMYTGRLNGTGEAYAAFELASYHACAGEDFQSAIHFHDLSAGCLGGRTPLTAASYVVADAMISGNETYLIQAGDFITANLSKYIEPRKVAVLLSVIEGRTILGEESPALYRMLSIGVIGVFVLLTSYIILIWEPKKETQQEGAEAEEQTEQDKKETEPPIREPETEERESNPYGENEPDEGNQG
jgi:hypothetical protein